MNCCVSSSTGLRTCSLLRTGSVRCSAPRRSIVGDLDLPVVLRRIVEVACDLVNARYGALGVIGTGRTRSRAVHPCRDRQRHRRADRSPSDRQGSARRAHRRPASGASRTDAADDARSVGFPSPPPADATDSWGCPFRVRDEVFGNLYLTESRQRRVHCGRRAGRARPGRDRRRCDRQRPPVRGGVCAGSDRCEASTLVTRQLLAVEGEEPLALIAGQIARTRRRGRRVSLVLPMPDGSDLLVEVASGLSADDLLGLTYSAEGSLAGQAFVNGRCRRRRRCGRSRWTTPSICARSCRVGPTMVLPLAARRSALAARSSIGRAAGVARISPTPTSTWPPRSRITQRWRSSLPMPAPTSSGWLCSRTATASRAICTITSSSACSRPGLTIAEHRRPLRRGAGANG